MPAVLKNGQPVGWLIIAGTVSDAAIRHWLRLLHPNTRTGVEIVRPRGTAGSAGTLQGSMEIFSNLFVINFIKLFKIIKQQ